MKIRLLAGSTYFDATTRAVFDGLRSGYESLGHEVAILTRPAAGPKTLSFPRTPDPGVRLIGGPGLPRRLSRETAGADLVHLHFSGWFRPWMEALIPLARRSPSRFIATFQDYAHPDLPANGPRRRASLRSLTAACGRVTAVSKHLKERIARGEPGIGSRIETVPNGVPEAAAFDAAASFAPPFPRPYMLSVGRLAAYKGIDLLLMAAAKIGPEAPDLVLCGAAFGGVKVRDLARRLGLAGKVKTTGLLPPEEVRRLQAGCLFYAAAPRAETFGIAVAEAMAAGKAVVAARTGAIPEFLTHGKTGLLVEPRDPDGLARAMRRLRDDPALRARLGRNALKACAPLRWSAVARRYLSRSGPAI